MIHAAWDPDTRGTSPGMIRKALNGRRTITVPLIEAVANALGVPPEDFTEYRLARARRLLDENAIGLEAAAENYELLANVLLNVTSIEERPAEQEDDVVGDVLRRLREARGVPAATADRADTQGEAVPPPPATVRRAGLHRARRPR